MFNGVLKFAHVSGPVILHQYPQSFIVNAEAARVSTMDLDDAAASVNILGGKGTNYTLGLNWYVNPNFRMMANYVRVVLNGNAKPDGGTAPFVTGDKFNIVQVRAALSL